MFLRIFTHPPALPNPSHSLRLACGSPCIPAASGYSLRSYKIASQINATPCVLRRFPSSVQEPPKIDPETPPEPPRHHPNTKSLPKTSPDLPKTSPRPISDHFFIQKRASEPQFSSQEFPIAKIDSPKSTFGGRRHGACPIR